MPLPLPRPRVLDHIRKLSTPAHIRHHTHPGYRDGNPQTPPEIGPKDFPPLLFVPSVCRLRSLPIKIRPLYVPSKIRMRQKIDGHRIERRAIVQIQALPFVVYILEIRICRLEISHPKAQPTLGQLPLFLGALPLPPHFLQLALLFFLGTFGPRARLVRPFFLLRHLRQPLPLLLTHPSQLVPQRFHPPHIHHRLHILSLLKGLLLTDNFRFGRIGTHRNHFQPSCRDPSVLTFTQHLQLHALSQIISRTEIDAHPILLNPHNPAPQRYLRNNQTRQKPCRLPQPLPGHDVHHLLQIQTRLLDVHDAHTNTHCLRRRNAVHASQDDLLRPQHLPEVCHTLHRIRKSKTMLRKQLIHIISCHQLKMLHQPCCQLIRYTRRHILQSRPGLEMHRHRRLLPDLSLRRPHRSDANHPQRNQPRRPSHSYPHLFIKQQETEKLRCERCLGDS